MAQHPGEGHPLATQSIGFDRDSIKSKSNLFDENYSRILESNLQGAPRLMAMLSLAAGIPIGEGPDGRMAPTSLGYLMPPALLYGGWINPAQPKPGPQAHKRGRFGLCVPPNFHPKGNPMARAHAAQTHSFPWKETFVPAVVTTPTELGPRHARIMAGLLLDLIARCASRSLEDVLRVVGSNGTFRQRLEAGDFRALAGRDLTVSASLDYLDQLRRTTFSVPILVNQWDARGQNGRGEWIELPYNLTVPGMTACPTGDTQEFDGTRDFQLFDKRLQAGKSMSIYWDARILGWAWSASRFMKKQMSKGGASLEDQIRQIQTDLIEATSPLVARDILMTSCTPLSLDHLRIGLEEPHHRLRSMDLIHDCFGVTDGLNAAKLASRARTRELGFSTKTRRKQANAGNEQS